MSGFFTVSHNSFHNDAFPWIMRIASGADFSLPLCRECEGPQTRLLGDMNVILERNQGSAWPDILGCGAYPLFIVSDRALAAWGNDKVGEFPIGGRISFLTPLPKNLGQTKPPSYFWLNGGKMLGAKLDFDASGFMGVQFCNTCGRRWDNVKATYDRQHSLPWSYVFVDRTWTGANLLTTDISPTAFFCTEKVIDSARKHRLTNFRFVPVTEGDAAGGAGMQYMQSENASASGEPA